MSIALFFSLFVCMRECFILFFVLMLKEEDDVQKKS
jgi:hypothetical protein